jgi:hypothetical protein
MENKMSTINSTYGREPIDENLTSREEMVAGVVKPEYK